MNQRRPARVDERDALQDAVHRQRHHDGRDAERHNAETVQEPDQGAESQGGRKSVNQGRVRSLEKTSAENSAATDRPRHGQIKPASKDHGALSERQNGQETAQHDQAVVVVPGQEGVTQHKFGGEKHKDETNKRRQRVAEVFGMTHPEGRSLYGWDWSRQTEAVFLEVQLARQRPGTSSGEPPARRA